MPARHLFDVPSYTHIIMLPAESKMLLDEPPN